MAPSFSNIPTELHKEIATYAAFTDDGCTIRALSEVSRHFKSVCFSRKYMVISICGENPYVQAERLEKLSQQLSRDFRLAETEGVQRPPIYHLAIEQPPNLSTEGAKSLFSIFKAALSTLRTLALKVPAGLHPFFPAIDTEWTARLLSIHWPNLSELTVYGALWIPYNELKENMGDDALYTKDVRFPNLTHLHLERPFSINGLFSDHRFLRLFPHLTHLNIHRSMDPDCDIVSAFDAMVTSAEQEGTKGEENLSLETTMLCSDQCPSSLTTVILYRSEGTTRRLSTMKDRIASQKGKIWWNVEIRDDEKSEAPLNNEDMKAEWLDRLQGGPGCWSTEEVEETDSD